MEPCNVGGLPTLMYFKWSALQTMVPKLSTLQQQRSTARRYGGDAASHHWRRQGADVGATRDRCCATFCGPPSFFVDSPRGCGKSYGVLRYVSRRSSTPRVIIHRPLSGPQDTDRCALSSAVCLRPRSNRRKRIPSQPSLPVHLWWVPRLPCREQAHDPAVRPKTAAIPTGAACAKQAHPIRSTAAGAATQQPPRLPGIPSRAGPPPTAVAACASAAAAVAAAASVATAVAARIAPAPRGRRRGSRRSPRWRRRRRGTGHGAAAPSRGSSPSPPPR